jgi:hypothetical protein
MIRMQEDVQISAKDHGGLVHEIHSSLYSFTMKLYTSLRLVNSETQDRNPREVSS